MAASFPHGQPHRDGCERVAPASHRRLDFVNPSRLHAIARIVLAYAVFGGLWIVLSDAALGLLPVDRTVQTQLSLYKGLAFVAATGLLLAWLLNRELRTRERDVAALRDSEARYRHLFDANPQPMWVYDRETLRFLAVNDAAVALYGWSRAEFMAMTIADIRPAEDVPRLREHLAQTAEEPRVESGPWRHRKRDGTPIDVEIHRHATRLQGRDAALVLALDVTEREKTRRAYQAQAERLKAYVSANPCIVYALTVGEDGFVPEWVSENVETLLGYPVEQALAAGWWSEHVHPDDRAAAAAAFDLLRDADTVSHDYRFRRSDGAWIWIHDQMRQQRDAQGRRGRVIGA